VDPTELTEDLRAGLGAPASTPPDELDVPRAGNMRGEAHRGDVGLVMLGQAVIRAERGAPAGGGDSGTCTGGGAVTSVGWSGEGGGCCPSVPDPTRCHSPATHLVSGSLPPERCHWRLMSVPSPTSLPLLATGSLLPAPGSSLSEVSVEMSAAAELSRPSKSASSVGTAACSASSGAGGCAAVVGRRDSRAGTVSSPPVDGTTSDPMFVSVSVTSTGPPAASAASSEACRRISRDRCQDGTETVRATLLLPSVGARSATDSRPERPLEPRVEYPAGVIQHLPRNRAATPTVPWRLCPMVETRPWSCDARTLIRLVIRAGKDPKDPCKDPRLEFLRSAGGGKPSSTPPMSCPTAIVLSGGTAAPTVLGSGFAR
jgi:hypothetical protein